MDATKVSTVSPAEASQLRILLANRPRMLREALFGVLEREAGVEVWDVEPDPLELLAAVERTRAHVVVVTLPESGEDPGICSHLLLEYPQLLVVALSPDRGDGFTYQLVIAKEATGHLGADSLLDLVRRRRASAPLLPHDQTVPRDAETC